MSASQQSKIVKRKKNRASTVQSRNMGSVRRMVQYYGTGSVKMERKMKPVHGVIPTLSISKSACYSFADFVTKFQQQVTRNAAGRPSKRATKSLTAGDIDDGFRSLSREMHDHIINNKEQPALLMGKGIYPLPLKRTMDIMKSAIGGRRVTKKAIHRLNEYTFFVTVDLIKKAASVAQFSKHVRIALDDFKTAYATGTFGLHKIHLDEIPRSKKKTASSYNRIKVVGADADGTQEGEDAQMDGDVIEVSSSEGEQEEGEIEVESDNHDNIDDADSESGAELDV